MGGSKSSTNREAYSDKNPALKRIISNNLTLHLNDLEKESSKFKVSTKKEIIRS
jgi:hypothetical protein